MGLREREEKNNENENHCNWIGSSHMDYQKVDIEKKRYG